MRFDDDYGKVYENDGMFFASYYQLGINKTDSLKEKIALLDEYLKLVDYQEAEKSFFCE